MCIRTGTVSLQKQNKPTKKIQTGCKKSCEHANDYKNNEVGLNQTLYLVFTLCLLKAKFVLGSNKL